jgi:hypothetical protein
MAQVSPGENASRAAVLDAAQQHGVDLDLAQATDSGVLQGAKRGNRYSLASQNTYDAATTKNLNALGEWADAEAGKYAPQSGGREVVGAQIQSELQNQLAQQKTEASQAFNDLDSKVGAAPVDATNTVEAEARKIISDNGSYYGQHPELKPKQAWAILQDLAERPVAKQAQAASGLLDSSGAPIPTRCHGRSFITCAPI